MVTLMQTKILTHEDFQITDSNDGFITLSFGNTYSITGKDSSYSCGKFSDEPNSKELFINELCCSMRKTVKKMGYQVFGHIL